MIKRVLPTRTSPLKDNAKIAKNVVPAYKKEIKKFRDGHKSPKKASTKKNTNSAAGKIKRKQT